MRAQRSGAETMAGRVWVAQVKAIGAARENKLRTEPKTSIQALSKFVLLRTRSPVSNGVQLPRGVAAKPASAVQPRPPVSPQLPCRPQGSAAPPAAPGGDFAPGRRPAEAEALRRGQDAEPRTVSAAAGSRPRHRGHPAPTGGPRPPSQPSPAAAAPTCAVLRRAPGTCCRAEPRRAAGGPGGPRGHWRRRRAAGAGWARARRGRARGR